MPASPSIGDVLDSKYRITAWLGGGAFGDVYLADDELARRSVAIKVLRETRRERQLDLVHEIRALNELQHPGIVTFYHHFVVEGRLFLVMEYCAGGSLRSRMCTKALTQTAALAMASELAATLEFVHRQGFVHHDIKPENILFTAEGAVKIGDLGVANRNAGTPPFLAPECFIPGGAAVNDTRVDVYALGITLLEILNNGRAFMGMSDDEMLRSKLKHDFIPCDWERWVQEVVAKATHPTPELRFQNMVEFREALDSKRVHYGFDRRRVQAHVLAAAAEKLLRSKRVSAASKRITQALYACPDCVTALVAAGRCCLFRNDIAEARRNFDLALQSNPRTNIQKELGWIHLESGSYAQAISLLTDHLQRNTDDYEAFNLLLECFYLTGRYDAGLGIAHLMIQEHAPSDCFESNALLCGVLGGALGDELVDKALGHLTNPFNAYNAALCTTGTYRLKEKLLFANYRFGRADRKKNSLVIERDGRRQEFPQAIVTIGRSDDNLLVLNDSSVSRSHCAIVNFARDVWLYDLGSTAGVVVDNTKVNRKVYLDGSHTLVLGAVELRITASSDLLL